MKMDAVSQPVGLVMFERGQRFPLHASLAYDRKEPYEVRILFPPGLEYLDMVLARELLAGCLVKAATFGAIRVWLVGNDDGTVCIGWRGPVGEARLEVPAVSVACFLDMTYCLVPEGGEPPRTDIDSVIAAILADGGAR
jgi:Streptomyces sporulation and cell division protein, SsgA